MVRKCCFSNLKIIKHFSAFCPSQKKKEHDFALASEVILSWSKESWFLVLSQKYNRITNYNFSIGWLNSIKYSLSRNKVLVICHQTERKYLLNCKRKSYCSLMKQFCKFGLYYSFLLSIFKKPSSALIWMIIQKSSLSQCFQFFSLIHFVVYSSIVYRKQLGHDTS